MADATYGYVRAVEEAAAEVVAGELDEEEGRRRIASLARGLATPFAVHMLTRLHLRLAQTDPARAIVAAELNHAGASALDGPDAAACRADTALAAGGAYLAQAQRDPTRVDLFSRAAAYLSEALPVLVTEAPGEAAAATTSLGLARLGVGEVDAAIAYLREGIGRWEALESSPARTNGLAQSYGNLGFAEEFAGETVAALTNHRRALDLFLEVKNLAGAKTALRHLVRLASQTGRSDDVLAVTEPVVALLAEQADVRGIVETYLAAAHHATRTHRWTDLVELLDAADRLLQPYLDRSRDEPDADFLGLFAELLIWQGTFLTLVVSSGDHDAAGSAYDALERARAIAARLGAADLVARAIVQKARLALVEGDVDAAEDQAGLVELVPADRVYAIAALEVLAEAALRRGDTEDAIALLEQVTTQYDDRQLDRRMVAFANLGTALERAERPTDAVTAYQRCLETFERTRLALYEESRLEVAANVGDASDRLITLLADAASPAFDPSAALEWVERTKSRTFVEVLGLSQMAAPTDAGAPTQALLEEQRLLERVNRLREQLFVAPSVGVDRMSLQQEMQVCLDRLGRLWETLATEHEEYVSLRQGRAIGWPELRSLVAERSPALSQAG